MSHPTPTITFADDDLHIAPSSDLDTLIAIRVAPVNVEEVITQILKNVAHDLESTRSGLERAGRKVIDDVRDAADTMGTALLRGVEQEIGYDDLVAVINALDIGLARRRVQLQN